MPELPEVETTRRGLLPHLEGQTIRTVVIRNGQLRWPVPKQLARLVAGRRIERLERRSKYLLLDCGSGWIIMHLGMSGSLRVLPDGVPPGDHDHFDLVLDSGKVLRLHDPRRFGAVLWERGDPSSNKLLRNMAPEPFDAKFDADWLLRRTRGRSASIKNVLMDNHIVCGVGNIYASEALFRAGIHPARPAGRISRERYVRLIEAIRETLQAAITAGGSTLRNFVDANGNPGYFQQTHLVYDRAGEPCRRCGAPIKTLRLGQRSAFYCGRCQR
ncbi:MAG: DNA-formamidopyrimidine glycosylase [Proteobacteria bacterium]|nr:MAG: DNA-formamidopyrimidine glycosylase [Pseudomonadota bacterium]